MDPVKAAEEIAAGKIDAVAIARQNLVDHEWVHKIMEGRQDEIKPCIRCHNGCFNFAKYKGTSNLQRLDDSLHLARCALNPTTMQHNRYKIVPTKKPKKVAIIGGGIGGMEAARVLALRGHRPVIYEKSDRLGGTFIAASAESYKGKLRELLSWYIRQMEQLNVEVHAGEEITDLSAFEGQQVIVATGSVPRVLSGVPGHERMIEACDYLTGTPVGQRVAVVGGGLTGCEIAYELALEGKEVVIVEMKDDLIAQKGVCLANSSYLREWFALHEVPVYLSTRLKEVKDGSIVCEGPDGIVELPCDSVISSAGYLPAPIAKEGGQVHLVGDCRKVGNLRSVIWRAYEVAMAIK